MNMNVSDNERIKGLRAVAERPKDSNSDSDQFDWNECGVKPPRGINTTRLIRTRRWGSTRRIMGAMAAVRRCIARLCGTHMSGLPDCCVLNTARSNTAAYNVWRMGML